MQRYITTMQRQARGVRQLVELFMRQEASESRVCECAATATAATRFTFELGQEIVCERNAAKK